ncbi:protein FAR1-RELATED SEQUENCE 5-like [Arachis duranensis]|uniref:Protein FAR1-RELATED SEQUENCE 5-like n=1 Tax=Arachis duranensis TaxID=130453 RepID=A0A6P4DK55_ARADU|nr:protein FAR1-RELATED SEQUENCE 5-like [Arachis duranensis]
MAEGAEEFVQQTNSPSEIVASQSISENIENYTSSDEVINQAIGDEEVDPEVGMCFGTLEDARAYYYRYAARTGFVVKIRTTGWETINDQRVVVNQALHCNRDGYRTSRVKAPQRRKTVASTNCKARCYLALDKMTGQWRISRVEVSHSHPLNPKLSGMFSANRQLSMHVKDLIQQNDQAGIRPSKTYQALANAVGGPANLTFTEKDVRNYISRHLRISGDETDPKELLKHFSRMKELNPNFFFEIDVDENHSIRNVFWADARCRAAWEYFGDVVTFDTTYKTNRYDVPFGSFVGVNHHGMSTLLGCALLRNEDTHMFADRHMWVPVFFKDEFWAGMRSTQRSESMHSVFDKYLNSKSSLLQFVRQYQNCVIDKEQKELECDAADLRGIIPCVSSSPIEKQFQREYTNSMFRDVQDQFIKKADCDISLINHHGTSIVCEVDQQKMVFDMSVYSRYQVVYCSQSSDVQCDCFMFQSNGILCCHSLAVLLHFRVTSVSSQYILSRWSKNVSRRHTYIRSSIDMDRSDESMTIFRQLCSDFYNIAQDFVATPEVAAILRGAMDSAREKLREHKEFEHQAAHVPSAIYSHTHDECPVSMDELHGPRRVPTRGRPTSTRLGADLEKSIKKRARKNKNTHNHNKGPNGNAQPSPTNVATSYKDTRPACSEMTDNLAMHSGSFISLLNSFHNAEQLCMYI